MKLVRNLLLMMLLLWTALQIVQTRYEYRRSYTQYETELRNQQKMLAEVADLQAQKRKLLMPTRLKQKAKASLQMYSPNADMVWYVADTFSPVAVEVNDGK